MEMLHFTLFVRHKASKERSRLVAQAVIASGIGGVFFVKAQPVGWVGRCPWEASTRKHIYIYVICIIYL